MKIEKINETQVRCTLTSFDLSIRNVNIKELTYGSEKAKSLFTEMMQRALQEVGFETEGYPVMVEAIPLKDESIVLVITRVEEPEELDTRFSRFNPMPGQGAGPLSGVSNLLKQAAAPSTLDMPPETGTMRTFVFDTLDGVLDAAHATADRFPGQTSLYKDPTGKKYYLAIESGNTDEALYQSTCNLLSEYGRLCVQNTMGSAYMREHYDVIIAQAALETLNRV